MYHKKTGLVLGKFMPLHKGHELLLTFASSFVTTLYVVVDNILDDTISGATRCHWIRQQFPQAQVYYLPFPNPQHPHEHQDFWNVWKTSLLQLLPEKPDYVFASEQYGLELATVLESTFIPVDIDRSIVPITGTKVRQAPLANWDQLSSVAREFYLKRICIFGPESTGKTTLSEQLAQHYKTRWVPEYARLYMDIYKKIHVDDMDHIARGQISLERAIAPLASKVLFCDTDPLSTMIWSQWLFGSCSRAITQLVAENTYDMYLLMSPDLEWKQDPVRFFPEKSEEFFNNCRDLLDSYNRKYVVISGKDESRLESAIKHIDEYLSCLE